MLKLTKSDTQEVHQNVTQEDNLDERIATAIKDNPNVTTKDIAKHFEVISMTIKRPPSLDTTATDKEISAVQTASLAAP